MFGRLNNTLFGPNEAQRQAELQRLAQEQLAEQTVNLMNFMTTLIRDIKNIPKSIESVDTRQTILDAIRDFPDELLKQNYAELQQGLAEECPLGEQPRYGYTLYSLADRFGYNDIAGYLTERGCDAAANTALPDIYTNMLKDLKEEYRHIEADVALAKQQQAPRPNFMG